MTKNNKVGQTKSQMKKWKTMAIVFGSLAGLGLVTSIAAPIIVKNSSKPIIDSDEVTINFTGQAEEATIVSKYKEKPRLNQDFFFYVFPHAENLVLESATIGTKQLTITNSNEVLIPAELMNNKDITVEITLGLPKVKLTVDSDEGVTIGETQISLNNELWVPVYAAPGVSITNITLYRDGEYFASSFDDPDAIGTIEDNDGNLCIFITGSYVTSYNISLCIETGQFVGPDPLSGESKIININRNALTAEGNALNFTFDISGSQIVEEKTVPTFKITNKLSNPLNGVFFFTQEGSLKPVESSIKDFTIDGGKEISFQPEIDWEEVKEVEQTYVPHFYAKQTLTGIKYDNDVDSRSLKTTLSQTNPYTIYNFKTTLTKDMFENEVYKTARNNFNKFQISYVTIAVSENEPEPEITINNCPFTIIRKSDNLANWEMGYWNDELVATEASEFYSSDESQEISIDFVLNQTIGDNQIVITNPAFELKAGYNAGYSSTILAQIGQTSIPKELVDAGFDGYYRDWTFADAFIAKDGEQTPEFTFKLDYELGEDKKYNFKFIDLNDKSEVKRSTTVEVQIKSNETLFTVKPNLTGFNLNSGMMNISLEVGENITNAKVYTGYVEDEGFESSTSEFDINSTQPTVTVPEVTNISGESKYGHFVLKIHGTDTQVASTESQTYSGEGVKTDIVFDNVDWTNINEGDQLDFHFVEDTKQATIDTSTISQYGFETATTTVDINSDEEIVTVPSVKNNDTNALHGHFILTNIGGDTVAETTEGETYKAGSTADVSFTNVDWSKIEHAETLELHFINDEIYATINIAAAEAESFKQRDGQKTIDIDSSETTVTIDNMYYDKDEGSGVTIFGYFVLKNSNNEVVAQSNSYKYEGAIEESIQLNNIDWNKINSNEELQLHFVETEEKKATLTLVNNASEWIDIDSTFESEEIYQSAYPDEIGLNYSILDTSAVGKNVKITLTAQGVSDPIIDKSYEIKQGEWYELYFDVMLDWSKIPNNSTLTLTIAQAENI